jgi:hypothetical protein
MPRESRHTFEPDSVGSDRTIVTRKSRANTWDSDVTTVNALDSVSSLEEKGKLFQQSSPQLQPAVVPSAHNSFTPSTNLVDERMAMELDMDPEDDVDMSDAAQPAAQHPLLQATDLWTLWEGEELTTTSTSAIPSRAKCKRNTTLSSKPRTRKRKLEIEAIDPGFDVPEVLVDDETQSPHTKKSRIAAFTSALHHRYVSLCLRIQLDAFRVEKKVKRKLRDPWLKPPPAKRTLSSGRS